MDDLICERFGIPQHQRRICQIGIKLLMICSTPKGEIVVAMVGKYVELPDAYKSVNEALLHAGIHNKTKVSIRYISAEALETDSEAMNQITDVDAILVPGGFGERGTLGKMKAIQFARENNKPF